jgi:hypothetical protein
MNKSIRLVTKEAGKEGYEPTRMVGVQIVDHDNDDSFEEVVLDSAECEIIGNALLSAGAIAECGGTVQ